MRGQAGANFETYNLITLFLSSVEIAALGRCLVATADDLRAAAEESNVRLSYTYYFIGVPGVGKSTSAGHFTNMANWDEWLDERLPEMSKQFDQLTIDEAEKVDKWVREQVGLKNRKLLDEERKSGIGLTVVDRCVPDAVTFTKPEGWSDKAKSLLEAISPGNSSRTVHSGQVIFLIGDCKEIRIRAAAKNKDLSEDYIRNMQNSLDLVYGEKGVTKISVEGLTVRQVVKEISHIIHVREYEECDLQGQLERIRDGEILDNASGGR